MTVHRLYEVVLTGAIRVLRKQIGQLFGADDANDFNYFVLYENTLTKLRKFRRLIYPKIIKQSKQLLAYVKRDKLNPNQAGNAIKIIQHYNRHSMNEDLAMN